MKKLVEIEKDFTVECIRDTDSKLGRKLTMLERKLNIAAGAGYEPVACIELAFFAVFEKFIDDLVIERTWDGLNVSIYSVKFTHGTIDDIELFINFSKD